MRSTIETAFYGNNVTPITSVAQAYQLATEEPGVIVLDMSVYKPCEQGLPADAKVLVTNDGKLQAAMQKLVALLAMKALTKGNSLILRDAVYDSRGKEWFLLILS